MEDAFPNFIKHRKLGQYCYDFCFLLDINYYGELNLEATSVSFADLLERIHANKVL